MAVPAVIGYMPLCVTPRSNVCDEQGVGQWPMWKRFDSVKAIVDQYIDEPYRDFLALPYHEIDKLKAEELFYWYTPRCDTVYACMNRMGDDRDYYREVFDKTMAHYQAAVAKLKSEGKNEDANFLQLSLKYAGVSEGNIYCGDGRVVVTVWGMRPKPGHNIGESKLFSELLPEVEMHNVQFELGHLGNTKSPIMLKKRHGSKIFAHQVPQVDVREGYECTGWDKNPVGAEVTGDLLFSAQYRELKKVEEPIAKHIVRFFTPDNQLIKKLEVEHGKRVELDEIPHLPTIEGVLCPSWDGDPLNDIINAERDYKAQPAIQKEPPVKHTVRFLAPDKHVILQMQVEQGTLLSSAQVPQLPVVDGRICPSWDADPLAKVIAADTDFTAMLPVQKPENKMMHTVRFLDSGGEEMLRTQVEHGGHLQQNQVPDVPIVDGKRRGKWSPNPTKQTIKSDTDFVLRTRRAWCWPWSVGHTIRRGFWRWLLRIVLFLLFVILVLNIVYRCNPCSQ